MNFVIKSINFIGSQALNHRQFQDLLSEINDEYSDLIYYTEVQKEKPIVELDDESYMNDLAFLATN